MNQTQTATRRAGWSWLIMAALALLVLGLDQGAKAFIVSRIPLYHAWDPIPALAHLFDLTFITNTGAAFGLFQDRSFLFAIIAIVISVGIIIYVRQLPQEEWLLRLCLAMQLGGAMGNLLDRVRLGYVVDFADFHQWPVFNFADTFIVVGVGLLAYCLLLRPTPPPPQVAQPPADVASRETSESTPGEPQ